VDVIRVGAEPVAKHLAQDAGATLLGMLEALEHDHRAAVAEDEAVAIHVERTARGLGRVVAG